MKAYALMDQLIALSEHREEETVDTCKAGDPERELKKVAVCCIATPDVIRQAAAWGADLLITHEPTTTSTISTRPTRLPRKNERCSSVPA